MLNLIAISACALFSESNPSETPSSNLLYVTRESALEEITVGNLKCKLRWAKDWQYNSEYTFLFVYHRHGIERSIFTIYLKLSKGFLHVRRVETGDAGKDEFLYFDHFSAFWWKQPVPPYSRVPIIWVQEVWDGSGHFETGRYFFTVPELPSLSELESADLSAVAPHIIQDVVCSPPPEPFTMEFKEGESWRKGHGLWFNEREMRFRNEIYPTGEKVYGTFKLVAEKLSPVETYGPIRVDTKYRIETDAFRRVPIKPIE